MTRARWATRTCHHPVTHVTNKRLRDIHEQFHGGQDIAQ